MIAIHLHLIEYSYESSLKNFTIFLLQLDSALFFHFLLSNIQSATVSKQTYFSFLLFSKEIYFMLRHFRFFYDHSDKRSRKEKNE